MIKACCSTSEAVSVSFNHLKSWFGRQILSTAGRCFQRQCHVKQQQIKLWSNSPTNHLGFHTACWRITSANTTLNQLIFLIIAYVCICIYTRILIYVKIYYKQINEIHADLFPKQGRPKWGTSRPPTGRPDNGLSSPGTKCTRAVRWPRKAQLRQIWSISWNRKSRNFTSAPLPEP